MKKICIYQRIFVSLITPISGSSKGSTLFVTVNRNGGQNFLLTAARSTVAYSLSDAASGGSLIKAR
jgi:hypothetical protein